MIAFVEGLIHGRRDTSVLVNVHGFGLEVFVCEPLKYKTGQPVFLYTFQQVREDAQELFGFDTQSEYDLFVKLLNVKGIGCRTALNILRNCPPEKMVEAIEQQDIALLKKLPGIGAKTAGQIVLDLKGKLVSVKAEEKIVGNEMWSETEMALESLGYAPAQILKAAKTLAHSNNYADVAAMLKEALRIVSNS